MDGAWRAAPTRVDPLVLRFRETQGQRFRALEWFTEVLRFPPSASRDGLQAICDSLSGLLTSLLFAIHTAGSVVRARR